MTQGPRAPGRSHVLSSIQHQQVRGTTRGGLSVSGHVQTVASELEPEVSALRWLLWHLAAALAND